MSDSGDAPALAPPPGVEPNFVDPYSLDPAFVATASLCLMLATLAVVIRLAISLRGPIRKIRIEDYTCVISWLGLITTCVFTIFEIKHGLGRHQWDVHKSDLQSLSKLFYINRIFYSPTILTAKVTVLVQLMRIFVPTKRGIIYRLIQTLIWLNASFYFANVVSVIFQCNPVPKAWEPSIRGKCINTNLNLIVTGTINVISDILILLLPLWTIWHLKLPIQKKLSVSTAFAAGIFANLAGICRLAYSIQILHGSDLTYLRLQHGMWTIAEITTVIICGSLPLAPKFWNVICLKRSTLTVSTSDRSGYSRSRFSRQYSNLGEASELQRAQFTPEPINWSKRGNDTSGPGKQLVLTSVYVSPDEELIAKGSQDNDKAMIKTVTIEHV